MWKWMVSREKYEAVKLQNNYPMQGVGVTPGNVIFSSQQKCCFVVADRHDRVTNLYLINIEMT